VHIHCFAASGILSVSKGMCLGEGHSDFEGLEKGKCDMFSWLLNACCDFPCKAQKEVVLCGYGLGWGFFLVITGILVILSNPLAFLPHLWSLNKKASCLCMIRIQ